MERLSAIQLSSDKALLTTRSQQQENDALADRLLELMAQAQAYFPNQTLPPGTPDAYLKAWEEIVAERSEEKFTAALWRACRKGKFFPGPAEIEEQADALAPQSKLPVRNEFLERWEKDKQHVEREREEDRLKPGYVPFDLTAEMKRIAAEKVRRDEKDREQANLRREEMYSKVRSDYRKALEAVATDFRARGMSEEQIQVELYGRAKDRGQTCNQEK